MATQVQFRRGTTGETSTFTGAVGEVTVDLSKNVCVVHDGSTAGGFPLLREDGVNMSLSPGSLSSCAIKFAGDPNTGLISPSENNISFVNGGVVSLALDGSGAASFSSNVLISGSLTVSGGISASTTAFPLGSAAAPSITFTGDTNTGIYSPGADQVAISTGGTGRLFVDSSGRVGIGTTSPNVNLHISSTGTPTIRIQDTDGTNQSCLLAQSAGISILQSRNDTSNGSIYLQGSNGSITTDYIRCNPTFTQFYAPGGSEAARIDSSGRLGLGTSSPNELLHVASGGNTKARISSSFSGSTDTGLIIDTTGDSSIGAISFHKAGSSRGDIAYFHNATGASEQLRFNVAGGSADLVIDGSGRVGIGTTSPGSTLDVNGTIRAGNYHILDGSTGAAGVVGFSTSNGPALEFWGSAAAGSGALIAKTAGSEAFRVDSSRRLLVGTSSVRVAGEGFQTAIGSQLYIEQPSSGLTPATFILNRNDANGPRIVIGKSRGTAAGSNTIVQADDVLGTINFAGADGTDLDTIGAQVFAQVDGTPGANDMPGRLVFSTTADGASSPTERMRITNIGNVGIGGTPAAGRNFALSTNITGATTSRAVTSIGQIQSDVTNIASYYATFASTAAASFTITDIRHYTAIQSTFGAGSVVTNQYGYFAENNLIGATNNYGFYSDIASGTGRWNFYSAGTADSYFASNNFIWANGGTERARIDSSGRLLVGTSSSLSAGNWSDSLIQVRGNSSGSAFEAKLALFTGKTIASGIGAGESLGRVAFGNGEGGEAAWITAQADAGWSASDYPGRLVFSTTADGASSPTERMRISSYGRLYIDTNAHQGNALSDTAPAKILAGAGTYTDTTTAAAGTVVHGPLNTFDNAAIAATNAGVVYTTASTVYIDGAPTAGTNVTITNPFALFVGAGQTSIPLGTAAAPSLTFGLDKNTGIYSPGADQIGFVTGGVERLDIDASGNLTLNGQHDLRFADADNSNWVAFQAPATVASNVTWTLPSADGSIGQFLSTDGTGTLSWSTSSGAANFQEFTSSGTWTKPAGANFVMIEVWGAGGGGGGGFAGATSTFRGGGAGGGGGAYNMRMYKAADVGATVTVTIGSGGTGSGPATVGGNGGNTTFGTLLSAYGGRGGSAGSNALVNGGGGGGTLSVSGTQTAGGSPLSGAFGGGSATTSPGFVASGFGGAAGGTGTTIGSNGYGSSSGGPGGGGGGGVTTGNAAGVGGPGGTQNVEAGGGGTAGTANGGTVGGAGGAGAAFQGGGGGGGNSGSTGGGTGGAGGRASGGGGGGGCLNTGTAGSGGAGGSGYVRVYTW